MTKFGSILALFVAVLVASASAFAPLHTPASIVGEIASSTELGMKCVHSIGALKRRSKTCQVVRRRGRIYVIDRKNPRNKVRQGGAKMKKRQKK